MNKLKYTCLLVFVSLGLVVAVSQGTHVSAQADASSAVCDALGDANSGSCTAAGSGAEVSNVIAVALNILSIAAGIIAVISLIISGLKYITAQGDANSISNARSSVIYALVGISIVVLSQVIVRFVINQATSPAVPPPAPTPPSISRPVPEASPTPTE